MKNFSLLDCTLRDGGYLNDWRFGHDNLVSIFERLVDANVDIIEIGFLDDRRPFDIDRSIMPDTESAGKIFEGLDRKQAMVVGMIDYGTCQIDGSTIQQKLFRQGSLTCIGVRYDRKCTSSLDLFLCRIIHHNTSVML